MGPQACLTLELEQQICSLCSGDMGHAWGLHSHGFRQSQRTYLDGMLSVLAMNILHTFLLVISS